MVCSLIRRDCLFYRTGPGFVDDAETISRPVTSLNTSSHTKAAVINRTGTRASDQLSNAFISMSDLT